jgi:hypothetical protein
MLAAQAEATSIPPRETWMGVLIEPADLQAAMASEPWS